MASLCADDGDRAASLGSSRVRTMPRVATGAPLAVPIASRRHVGYYEFGDLDGTPVFALHGTPGCGSGFLFAHEDALERGVRLIAPDRPGVGFSDRAKRRPVRAYADDLGGLADALGIDTFDVFGYSGGGPFACAAAYGLPDRVNAAAVVSGAGQVGVWAKKRESDLMDWFFMSVSRRSAFVASGMMRAVAGLVRRMPQIPSLSLDRELGESDVEAFATPARREAAVRMFIDAFARGTRGVVDDYASIAEPWGFPVEDIKVPLTLFQGDADTIVPMHHTEALAARVPDADVVVWPGAGHFGVFSRVGEVLDALLAR
jgi:pimeloyl-ACP methyl ester carboxylesterase